MPARERMQPSLIEKLFDEAPKHYEEEHHRLFRDFKAALNRGEIRAAEPDPSAKSGWRVNAWVKKGILLGFRMGAIADMSIDTAKQPFFDKSTYPVRTFTGSDGVRIVPGGSSIRDGTYIGRGVICMPPMFVNVGAYVGDGTMIDSHALVGSCAQVGKSCHISAGAQIGGVLEPAGALPVIIEDDVLVGGNCGVYEGTIVREQAVLAPGVFLTGGMAVVDVVRNRIYRRDGEHPLEIPAGAVVVPGSRPMTKGVGSQMGISLYTPVVVKYRDEKTETAV